MKQKKLTQLLTSIIQAPVQLVTKLAETLKNILIILGELFGCRLNKDGSVNCDRLMMAGFVFLVGAPIGILLFGEIFTVSLWASVVLTILTIANLDTALHKMIQIREN